MLLTRKYTLLCRNMQVFHTFDLKISIIMQKYIGFCCFCGPGPGSPGQPNGQRTARLGGVWYVRGMRMVCARYARMVVAACGHIEISFIMQKYAVFCAFDLSISIIMQKYVGFCCFCGPGPGSPGQPNGQRRARLGGVWYARGMRMVCARYARMVVAACGHIEISTCSPSRNVFLLYVY